MLSIFYTDPFIFRLKGSFIFSCYLIKKTFCHRSLEVISISTIRSFKIEWWFWIYSDFLQIWGSAVMVWCFFLCVHNITLKALSKELTISVLLAFDNIDSAICIFSWILSFYFNVFYTHPYNNHLGSFLPNPKLQLEGLLKILLRTFILKV